MLKPHGDAILPDDKRYFNCKNSREKLITEGALERLKIKFRVVFGSDGYFGIRKHESKKTLK